MLRQSTGARRYNDMITLMRADSVTDDYGHMSVGEPAKVMDCHAYVRQMSSTKTMMTFQQADVVGLEIEFRHVTRPFTLIEWRGHKVYFPSVEDVDNRGRVMRIQGYYQKDNPNPVGNG